MIRDATPADADALLDLIQEHAAFERSQATLGREALLSVLADSTPPTHLFVAEESNRLVGYAALTFDYSLWRGERYGHLDCLFVREDCRGRRLGEKLLGYVKEKARGAGAERLEWQTPDWNEGAVRFYRREGGTALVKMRFSLDLTEAPPAGGPPPAALDISDD